MMIAATRMTGNVIAAIVLLVTCNLMLRLLRRKAPGRQRGLPLVALIAGPLFSAFYILIDYNWIQPASYLSWDDAVPTIVRVLIVGVVGGSVGAISIWAGLFTSSKLRASRDRSGGDASQLP